jgi:aryl-phospho-beta-D-glucosidase BglC (GH1 family)
MRLAHVIFTIQLWSYSCYECDRVFNDDVIDCSGYSLQHGKLRLKGLQLVNQRGQPIQLRGLSSAGLGDYPLCVTKQSIQYLVERLGITVFRAAVNLDSLNGYASNPGYFDEYLLNLITWCEELGIYFIIDWHVLLAGDPNVYLDSPGATTGIAVTFWQKYATLCKDMDHVLYEIANEPNNVSWNATVGYHNIIIDAIRAIDQETIIIAGTTTFSQDLNLAAALPVKNPYNVMYSFHFYAASHDFLLPLFSQYIDIIPVFISEWGMSTADGNGTMDSSTAQQYLAIASDNNIVISWVAWSWNDKYETAALLVPGSCGRSSWQSSTCAGSHVEQYLKEPYITDHDGCRYSSTTYPTSQPTSPPKLNGDKNINGRARNAAIIYGPILGFLGILGCALYYLQKKYYPRMPPRRQTKYGDIRLDDPEGQHQQSEDAVVQTPKKPSTFLLSNPLNLDSNGGGQPEDRKSILLTQKESNDDDETRKSILLVQKESNEDDETRKSLFLVQKDSNENGGEVIF